MWQRSLSLLTTNYPPRSHYSLRPPPLLQCCGLEGRRWWQFFICSWSILAQNEDFLRRREKDVFGAEQKGRMVKVEIALCKTAASCWWKYISNIITSCWWPCDKHLMRLIWGKYNDELKFTNYDIFLKILFCSVTRHIYSHPKWFSFWHCLHDPWSMIFTRWMYSY